MTINTALKINLDDTHNICIDNISDMEIYDIKIYYAQIKWATDEQTTFKRVEDIEDLVLLPGRRYTFDYDRTCGYYSFIIFYKTSDNKINVSGTNYYYLSNLYNIGENYKDWNCDKIYKSIISGKNFLEIIKQVKTKTEFEIISEFESKYC